MESCIVHNELKVQFELSYNTKVFSGRIWRGDVAWIYLSVKTSPSLQTHTGHWRWWIRRAQLCWWTDTRLGINVEWSNSKGIRKIKQLHWNGFICWTARLITGNEWGPVQLQQSNDQEVWNHLIILYKLYKWDLACIILCAKKNKKHSCQNKCITFSPILTQYYTRYHNASSNAMQGKSKADIEI